MYLASRVLQRTANMPTHRGPHPRYGRSTMSVAIPVLLIINGVFNVVTWPTFLRRVAKDPRARDATGKPSRFLMVHIILVTIALTLAAVSLLGGVLALLGVW